MISFDNKVTVPSHVLVRVLDREAVLLNIETERYFGLDEIGTRMWELITTSPSLEVAYQALLSEYDVEPATLRQNLQDLLEKLRTNGLLNLTASDVGTAPTV